MCKMNQLFHVIFVHVYVTDDTYVLMTSGVAGRTPNVIAVSSSSLVFAVTACSEALLALSVRPRAAAAAYEVVLGGEDNTMCEVRRGVNGTATVHLATDDVLHCAQMR